MNDSDWKQLVDLIHQDGHGADLHTVAQLVQLQLPNQEAETLAARANMTTIVRMLHDPSSQMMDMLLAALRDGKLCVVDVSQMRGTPALVLSGLILRRIFDHNQEEFTKAKPQTIPVIAVVEEAQAVLGSGGSSGEGPYISWVKEGRKYDLGAVLITQQPGSITGEILSQGDNWFAFHLLSVGDLRAVKNANAHFSDDILSSLLNEPIPGHGVFWSSVGGKSYPIPIRVLSFEGQYSARDPKYDKPAAKTPARTLRERFASALESARRQKPAAPPPAGTKEPEGVHQPEEDEPDEEQDALGTYEDAAIEVFKSDAKFLERVRRGIPWKGVVERLKEELPDVMSDQDKVAYDLVPTALNAVFGKEGWKTEKRPSKSKPGYFTTWVVVTDGPGTFSA